MMTANRDRWSKKVLMAGLPVYDLFRPLVHRVEDVTWGWRGRPYPPPPPVKQRAVMDYGRRFGLGVLVETGTFLGDMVEATKEHFAQIISIELDEQLAARAKRHFSSYSHIAILHGDSSHVLPQVLAEVDRPALFWLDAHYSGSITARGSLDTPIVSELDSILSHCVASHIILIDDARIFNGQNGYPETAMLRDFLLDRRLDWKWEVRDDIIRFRPPFSSPHGAHLPT